jgi:hypothetical protein
MSFRIWLLQNQMSASGRQLTLGRSQIRRARAMWKQNTGYDAKLRRSK